MKSFNKLRNFALGEFLSFVQAGSRVTISGVASESISVLCQGETMAEPVLFQQLPAGQFSFSLAHDEPFSLWFDGTDTTVLAVEVPANSTVVEGDPTLTWTTVGHRPAMDPNLAAVYAQLRSMQSQLAQSRAKSENMTAQAKRKANAAAYEAAQAAKAAALAVPVIEPTADLEAAVDPVGVTTDAN